MTKERKLPFKCAVFDKEPVEVSNRFSGESITIPPDAVAVYDVIMGLDWFIKHEPDAYMVLLD